MRRPSQGARVEELQRIYETRLPALRRVADGMVADREQALDVVQEAFARAVRLRRSFDGRGSLEGWVWRIVVNTARDQVASRTRQVFESGHERSATEEPSELMGQVRAAVMLLPDRQRVVLFLRYYADLDYRAIAEVLGISIGTVGATLSSAHDRLRPLLEEVSQ